MIQYMQNKLSQVRVRQQQHNQEPEQAEVDNTQPNQHIKTKYIVLLLTALVNRKLAQAMLRLHLEKYKRIAMQLALKIVSSLCDRTAKRNTFNQLKLYSIDSPKNNQPQKQGQKQQITSFHVSNQFYSNPTQQESRRIYQIIKSDLSKSVKNVSTERQLGLIELEFVNKMLSAEIRELKQQIDSLHKRQERQNTKKKESLEMLAEQLQEKNQVIQDLKRSLSLYEQRYETANNILDSETDSLRKELQNSERIRSKIQNDLDITKSKLQKSASELKKATTHLELLQKKLKQIQNTREHNKIKNEQLTKSQAQLDKLIKSIKQKSKQINFYMQSLQSKQYSVGKVQELENSVKLEIVFDYLANFRGMEQPNYMLFSQEEINILVKHRLEWIQAGKQLTDFQDYQPARDQDFSGIVGKGMHQNHQHSIFEFLDSPQIEIQADYKSNAIKAQREKNRLYEQITELKSKIFHIRGVILNFLKALDIEVGKRSDAQPVLELIFEIFQYSEEERLSIFAKKKKFFSFM